MKNLVSIKLNKEFKRAYFQGKFKPHPALVTYIIKNRYGYNRVGITTSKKIGKAVERNRARRVIRAAFLATKENIVFSQGYDIVFVARGLTPQMKSTEIQLIMERQIRFLLNQTQGGKKKQQKGTT